MPVRKCGNGKWRIGSGPCMYTSEEAANRAYRGYLASEGSKDAFPALALYDGLQKAAAADDKPPAKKYKTKKPKKPKKDDKPTSGVEELTKGVDALT